MWRDWVDLAGGLELPSSKKFKSGGSGEPERESWAELLLLLALRFMPARERLCVWGGWGWGRITG